MFPRLALLNTDATTQATPVAAHAAAALCWASLSSAQRLHLRGKLTHLYAQPDTDAEIFDWLAPDKQYALVLLLARLTKINLWRYVRRFTNLYGICGTGCEFIADESLESALRLRKDFTTRFAQHKGSRAGFLQRRTPRAALHLLHANRTCDIWSAHFDLFSPVASPLCAVRHIWHERLRGACPSWNQIMQYV